MRGEVRRKVRMDEKRNDEEGKREAAKKVDVKERGKGTGRR